MGRKDQFIAGNNQQKGTPGFLVVVLGYIVAGAAYAWALRTALCHTKHCSVPPDSALRLHSAQVTNQASRMQQDTRQSHHLGRSAQHAEAAADAATPVSMSHVFTCNSPCHHPLTAAETPLSPLACKTRYLWLKARKAAQKARRLPNMQAASKEGHCSQQAHSSRSPPHHMHTKSGQFMACSKPSLHQLANLQEAQQVTQRTSP